MEEEKAVKELKAAATAELCNAAKDLIGKMGHHSIVNMAMGMVKLYDDYPPRPWFMGLAYSDHYAIDLVGALASRLRTRCQMRPEDLTEGIHSWLHHGYRSYAGQWIGPMSVASGPGEPLVEVPGTPREQVHLTPPMEFGPMCPGCGFQGPWVLRPKGWRCGVCGRAREEIAG